MGWEPPEEQPSEYRKDCGYVTSRPHPQVTRLGGQRARCEHASRKAMALREGDEQVGEPSSLLRLTDDISLTSPLAPPSPGPHAQVPRPQRQNATATRVLACA